MSRLTSLLMLLVLALASTSVKVYAQAPTGTIEGTVTDASGAIVPNATVTITNKATGAVRNANTSAAGTYSAPALPAGDYSVKVEVSGFRTQVTDTTLQVGGDVTVNTALSVGTSQEVVNVEAAASQINYESHTVQGVIEQSAIQELPLNGRSYMQLASLEPGVTIAAGSTAQFNALFTVSILGAGNRTLFTIDGGSVSDNIDVASGISAMNFSQELVQEFQLSSVNFDLSTGVTAGGAINVVTRSGTNDFHGSAYFFYRDHNMAAFPLLQHVPGEPLSPYFVRKQPGVAVGGPIKKDRTFFFFSYENTTQVQALENVATDPAVVPLTAAYPSPYTANLYSIRFDHRINSKNNLFLRYSHDGNNGFGPSLIAEDPSGWANNTNWADQSIIGLTSTLTPTIVNDLRFEYNYWSNKNLPTTAGECSAPCVGGVLPTLYSVGGFAVGNNLNSPQARQTRRFEETDALSWQKGSHRFKFGGDADRAISAGLWGFCTPFCESALSPATVGGVEAGYAPYAALLGVQSISQFFPTVPAVLHTDADVLNLPFYSLPSAIFEGIGVGPTATPSPYNRGANEPESQYRVYAQDVWKVKSNFTFNYGLGWNGQVGWYGVGLPMPASGYLDPIFGAGNRAPTGNNLKEFQPAVGFAWSPFKSNKTVLRGGFGIYWDSTPGYYKLREGASIGPVGDGRATISSTAFTNIYPGIFDFSTLSPLAIGASIPTSQITNLTIGQFLNIYNQQIGTIQSKLFPGTVQTSGPYTTTGIDLTKTGVEIYPPGNFPLARSYQTSLGIQQDLGHDLFLTADWARRQGENVSLGEVDMNHTNLFSNGVEQPLIPQCTQAQLYVPGQECSNGAITVYTDEGKAVYNGLLLKVQKRLSHRYQFTASYALQREYSDTSYYNTINWESGYSQILPHQNFNISGIYLLPWGFELSLNSAMIARGPAAVSIGNYPLPGVATSNQPLPGLPYNCLNVSCGKSDVANAVAQYNATYAGTKAANGSVFPKLILPANWATGSALISQDIRLTKRFTYRERYKLAIVGEMFNALNVANLSIGSFTVDAVNANPAAQSYAFGQPTNRVSQTFGQGGPRAVQVSARVTF